ncbi:MAG: hypothetical protein HY013_13225 [Candidatus Solibacter usitatus]|nr:hypothetical protein [Candidatus Solibacter usitatus]
MPYNPQFPPEYPIPEPHPVMPEPSGPTSIPIVFERGAVERIPLRVYAAIHLRVPESGIAWLDRMIRRSRELDRTRKGK